MPNPNEAHDEACCCFECWQKKYPFVYIPELDIVEQEFRAQEQHHHEALTLRELWANFKPYWMKRNSRE